MDEKLTRLSEIMQEANSIKKELAPGYDIVLTCDVTAKEYRLLGGTDIKLVTA